LSSKFDVLTQNGETALALACAAGHHVCVRLLLKARAELMATARNGMNAFLFAAQSGSVECLTACLQSYHDQSAMLKSQTLSGESALHLAAKCANPAAIQCLLQSGPAIRSMINLTDIQGQMPAHVAARSDRPGPFATSPGFPPLFF
jgi:ankyrin repeat protein